ncbi:MAG: DUF47 family protein [Solirubrobacteraceae bacterium]|nr:DUF47 family protein [Solirubrobacteraceae bacterium]
MTHAIDMFGPVLRRSPPPRDHVLDTLMGNAGKNARRAAHVLHQLIVDCPDGLEGLAEDLSSHEHEGDKITHDLIHRLRELGPSRSPIDLGDGFRLATTIDDILDHIEQTAALMVVFNVEATMEQAVALASVLDQAAERVAYALDAYVSGQELGPHLTEIHRLENEGDRINRQGLTDLFAGGIDPMVVIRWKDIYESLESAIDACESVAIQIESLQLTSG